MRPVDLCDEIYRELTREIVSMQLLPGQTISENGLCERFGVSRTPIRSVLQRLSHNRLVEIVPHKHTIITLIDYDILRQIIYERVAVECMVFRDFVLNHTQEQLDQARHAMEEMRKLALMQRVAPQKFNPNRFFSLDRSMHKLWFQATGNPYLFESFESDLANYNRFCMMDIQAGRNTADVMEEHESMLRLVETGDISQVEPLLKRHFYGGLRRLESHIFDDLAPYFSNLPQAEETPDQE